MKFALRKVRLPCLVLLAALIVGPFGAAAGQKILFSGRDGRKAEYHRSLNARPLFQPQAVAGRMAGESPDDEIHAIRLFVAPARKNVKGDDEDKDWAFQSSDESGAERVEKEILGEDEDKDDLGIKRSRVERFLEREREKKEGGEGSGRRDGRGSRERRGTDRDVELQKFQSSVLGNSGEPRISTGGDAAGVPAQADSRAVMASPADTGSSAPVMDARSSMEFHRDHVNRLKQSLGVAAAQGVDPFGGFNGGNAPQRSVGSGTLPAAQPRSPGAGGAPRPESIGAYPGSQGLGLMDLTTPASAPTALQPRQQSLPSSRPARPGLGRTRKPKRDIF